MEQELYHYGVLGMKWGIRRYQNADGSLTAEGKKRARKEYKEDNKKAFELGRKATLYSGAYDIANKKYSRLAKRGVTGRRMDIAAMTARALFQATTNLSLEAEQHRQALIDKYGEKAVSDIKYDKNGNINEKIYTLGQKLFLTGALAVGGPIMWPAIPYLTSKRYAYRDIYSGTKQNALFQLKYEEFLQKNKDKIEKELSKKLNDELKHHGIEGQKWGVRRGPPYPIEDRILRKGTRLNSVSPYGNSEAYRKNGKWMYTYRDDEEWDNKVYKGPFTVYKAEAGARFIFEHKYETVKDLLMPTKKQRMDAMKDLPRKQLIKDLEVVRKRLVDHQIGTEEQMQQYKTVDLQNLKTDKDWAIAYSIFNHAMENIASTKSTMAYAKIMSKKFGAMVDDNNQGIYNDAHDPIIIFNAKKYLKTLSKYTVRDNYVSPDQVKKNYEEVAAELAKKGKMVLL